MKNVTGSPVSGEDFFDREDEQRRIREVVMAGNHVLLSAPRRVGKTSLVRKLCDTLGAEGWSVLWCDVQAVQTEEAFFEILHASAKKAGLSLPKVDTVARGVRWLQRRVKGSKLKAAGVEAELGAGEETAWSEHAMAFEQAFSAQTKKQRVLVAIDELPIFLTALSKKNDGRERVASLLNWLRALRHSGTVTMVVCGSIGLDSFVERHALAGTINDFTIMTLGAYPDSVAGAFLNALAQSSAPQFGFSEETLKAVHEKLGWSIPYALQLLFFSLTELPQERRTDPSFPTCDDVLAAYQKLLEPHQRTKFSPWDTRLDEQFSDLSDPPRARRVLTYLCTRPRGAAWSDLLEHVALSEQGTERPLLEKALGGVIDLLERDGYLLKANSRYAFRSFLLRDYWKARHAR